MKCKLTALLAAAIMMFALPVCAEVSITDLSTNPADSSITVTGTTTEKTEKVILTVLTQGTDMTDAEEFFNNLAYQTQLTSHNGKFTHIFRINGKDLFTLYATTADNKDKYDFAYGDSTALETALLAVNDAAASGGDVGAVLRDNKDALGLLFDDVEEEPIWSSLGASVKDIAPLSTVDLNASSLALKRQLIFQYVKEGKIENIFTYDKYLDILSMPNNDVFAQDLFTEDHAKEATERLLGVTITGYDEFTDKITEAMILAVVKNPDGFGNVKLVLEAHEETIDINTYKVDVDIYRELQNQNFSSLKKLKEAYDALYDEYKEKEKEESKGSGGGGSGDKDTTAFTPIGGGVAFNPSYIGEGLFYDIDSYGWAKESIEGLAEKGIVSGKAEGRFYPADKVTRSEFVKMIVLALDIKSEGGDINFSDVSKSAWDYAYIKTAYNAGIIQGLGDGLFGGNTNISRQDMAVIMERAMRYCGKTLPEASSKNYADDAAISDYARNAAYVLRAAGVMTGDDANNMNPRSLASRAEAAKVIYSVIK